MDEMRVGCENCTQCFNGCEKPFPEKFLEGGAETCETFSEEKSPETIYSNMVRFVEEMQDKLAEEGIYC